MLRDDRPLHEQSLRSQNHSPHARLQTSPTGKGKRAAVLIALRLLINKHLTISFGTCNNDVFFLPDRQRDRVAQGAPS
jgi:hypothetical protein